ncbi:MAG TPA: hypothetical protein VF743_05450 [Acidimicrobiales bacterium]
MTHRPRRPASRPARTPPLAARVVAGAAVPLLLVALAACGGDDDDDDGGAGPGTTAPAEEATGACALLTTDEVSDLFGAPAGVVAPAGEDPTSCLWEAAEEDGGGFPTRHQLQLSVFEGGTPLDSSTYGPNARPVDDLGDEAFVVPTGFLGTTAGYQSGDRSVVLTYAIIADEGAPDASEQADQVVDLLRTVDERSG